MKGCIFRWGGLALVTAALLPGPAGAIGGSAAAMDFSPVVARAAPAVVAILGHPQRGPQRIEDDIAPPDSVPDRPGRPEARPAPLRRDRAPAEPPGPGAGPQPVGSGFFISAAGAVATCDHVLEDIAELSVRLADGRVLPAVVVGRDPLADLAVLRVDAGAGLPFLEMEAGATAVPLPGQPVLALGSPLGFAGTATAGIVSSLDRFTEDNDVLPLLQHDAALNRGSSGGPLLDGAGRLIGINNAIQSPSGGSVGLSFAIPIGLAMPVLRHLLAEGRPRHGWLGVEVQSLSPALAAGFGVAGAGGALVLAVTTGGPADLAGLRIGDIVVAVDGVPVDAAPAFRRAVYRALPGTAVALALAERGGGGGTAPVRAIVGAPPAAEPVPSVPAAGRDPAEERTASVLDWLGLAVAHPSGARTAAAAAPAETEAGAEGVRLIAVAEDGPAAGEGLRTGDRILAVGRRPVADPDALSAFLDQASAEGGATVPVLVERGGERQFLLLPLPPAP